MSRILVVEDNPLNLKLASVILRSAGYDVLPAVDAEDANRVLAKSTPDLILMDIGLPGKDGYTFARELRSRPDTELLPILAVTSFAMKGDEQKAREAGCTDYMTKPIIRLELLGRVHDLLKTPSRNANLAP
jgi:CheY-like chemotaxis protein